jgi:hypothetical protein
VVTNPKPQVSVRPFDRKSAKAHPGLKRPDPTVYFVIQGAMNSLVEATRLKIGLNASIDGLRTISLKP